MDLLTHVMDVCPDGIFCLAADTDRYHLQIARAHSKVHLRHQSCSDEGTRGDARLGKEAAILASGSLVPALENAEVVFVLAGMGGGTGSGAAPVFSDIARKCGALVIGLVTKPFHFERGRLLTAVDSMRRMLNVCDTVILLDNQPPEPSSAVLPVGIIPDRTGQSCCAAIDSIIQALRNSSFIAGGMREFRSMLRRGGLAKVGVGESYSFYGAAEEAALNALRSSLLLGELTEAGGVFVDIAADDAVPDVSLSGTLELISRQLSSEAELLLGRRSGEGGGITKVNLIVTGVQFPYAWSGYRRFPLPLYELEPGSGEDEATGIELELPQLESIAA